MMDDTPQEQPDINHPLMNIPMNETSISTKPLKTLETI